MFGFILMLPAIFLIVFGYFMDWQDFRSFNFYDFLGGQFQENLDVYFKDKIPIYSRLSYLKTNIDILTGQTISNRVLVRNFQLTKIFKPISYDKSDLFVKHVNSFVKNLNKPLYYLIIPSKLQLNESPLKFYSDIEKKNNLYDYLNNNLDYRFTPLDYAILFENSKEVNAYYRTTDQLNSYGAYMLYSSCIKGLGLKPYDMQNFKIYHLVRDYYGDLYSRKFYNNIKSDTIDIFKYCGKDIDFEVESINVEGNISKRNTIYDISRINDFRKINVIFGKKAVLKHVKTNLEAKEQILIFADRFINELMQFFSLHYKKITVVDLHDIFYSKSEVFEEIRKIKTDEYDRILFIYGIESLNDDEQFRNLKYFRR